MSLMLELRVRRRLIFYLTGCTCESPCRRMRPTGEMTEKGLQSLAKKPTTHSVQNTRRYPSLGPERCKYDSASHGPRR